MRVMQMNTHFHTNLHKGKQKTFQKEELMLMWLEVRYHCIRKISILTGPSTRWASFYSFGSGSECVQFFGAPYFTLFNVLPETKTLCYLILILLIQDSQVCLNWSFSQLQYSRHCELQFICLGKCDISQQNKQFYTK